MTTSIVSKKHNVVFDEGRNPRAKMGFILVSMEQTIEEDVFTLMPKGVGIHFTRIQLPNEVTVEGLMTAAGKLPEAASLILPDLKLDAIAFACTSGSFVVGEERCIKLMSEAAHNAPATTMVTAVIHALNAFNAKKIVVGTPYIDSVNSIEAEYFTSRGFEILDIQGLNIEKDEDMVRVTPQFLKEFAMSIDRPDADAIFLSCGALRSIDIIDELEQAVGKPVITSNQALVWDSLRLANLDDKVPGYGRLFIEH